MDELREETEAEPIVASARVRFWCSFFREKVHLRFRERENVTFQKKVWMTQILQFQFQRYSRNDALIPLTCMLSAWERSCFPSYWSKCIQSQSKWVSNVHKKVSGVVIRHWCVAVRNSSMRDCRILTHWLLAPRHRRRPWKLLQICAQYPKNVPGTYTDISSIYRWTLGNGPRFPRVEQFSSYIKICFALHKLIADFIVKQRKQPCRTRSFRWRIFRSKTSVLRFLNREKLQSNDTLLLRNSS